MMTLQEMQLAVCGKLPDSVSCGIGIFHWITKTDEGYIRHNAINWPTEGLQVCHEAEKLLTPKKFVEYKHLINFDSPYEQRLEALTRVWFPELWS